MKRKKVKYLALIPSDAIRNNRRKAQRNTWVYEAKNMLQAFFICPNPSGDEGEYMDTLYLHPTVYNGKDITLDILETIEFLKWIECEWVLICDDLLYLWMTRANAQVSAAATDVVAYEEGNLPFYFIRRSALKKLKGGKKDIREILRLKKMAVTPFTDVTHPLQYPKTGNKWMAVVGQRPDKILRIHERRKAPHVAVITIALGKYDRFFGGWYESIQYYFLNSCTRHYYVFTDNPDLPYVDCEYCTVIMQDNLGWPGNTRDRFEMFLKLKQEIEENFDYVYFFQVTARLTTYLEDKECIPTQTEAGMWITRNVDLPNGLTYDPNPNSTAHIPEGMGKFYAQGGAFGGVSKMFFQMCEECVLTIKHNQENRVGEYLNDESHMNRYFLTRTPKEGWLRFWGPPSDTQVKKYNCKVFTLDKRRFGGFRALKELKKKE